MSHVRLTYSTLNDDIIQIIQEDEVLFSFIKALLLSKFKKDPIEKLTLIKKIPITYYANTEKNKDYLIEIHFLHLFDNIIHKFFHTPHYKQEDYSHKQQIIIIKFLTFPLFLNTTKFHSIYLPVYNYSLSNQLEYHFIELPKVIKAWQNQIINPLQDHFARWLLFLGMIDQQQRIYHESIYEQLWKIAKIDKSLERALVGWKNKNSKKVSQSIMKA